MEKVKKDKKDIIKDITRETVTLEVLDQVPYGSLLETFTQLGIAQVWKPGSKKVKMIQTAIEALNQIKQMEIEGMSEEQIQDKLNGKEESEKQLEQSKNAQSKEEEKKQSLSLVEKFTAMKMSKETIEKNLRNIELNLRGKKYGRDILIKKREALRVVLDKMD